MNFVYFQLSFDLLESWLAKNPDVSGFRRDGKSIFRELALFQDYHGLPDFKKALVEFMADIRGKKVSFDPNHIVLTAGSTSANETLMFCLADQGEAFLLPTPYYPGYISLSSFTPTHSFILFILLMRLYTIISIHFPDLACIGLVQIR